MPSDQKPTPNRDAARQTLEIYQDAMRLIIMLNLTMCGSNLDLLTLKALHGRNRQSYLTARANNIQIENSINLEHFEPIVRTHWETRFHTVFAEREILQDMENIQAVYIQASRNGPQDIDRKTVDEIVSAISRILGDLDKPGLKQAIERVGADLLP